MIHPHLQIRWCGEQRGYGLFATRFIPKGTITFVQDDLDIVLTSEAVNGYPDALRKFIDTYSYQDFKGDHVISWDLGKYMNHCCHANTLTTGFGFEIAVDDIQAGTEVTDDYRLFATAHQMNVNCGRSDCEKSIEFTNLKKHFPIWDQKIEGALAKVREVDQPLMDFCGEEILADLRAFLDGKRPYPSVASFIEGR